MMGMRMTVSETSSQKHPRQQTSNGKEKRILTAISFSMSFRLVLVLMERNKRKKKKIWDVDVDVDVDVRKRESEWEKDYGIDFGLKERNVWYKIKVRTE